jgi:xylulokinase
MFGYLLDPKPSGVEGHIFANPVYPSAYMVMLCRLNGSLARERVRDASAGGSWDVFSEALGKTRVGNAGRVGIYLFEPEISPPTANTGTFLFDADGKRVDALPPEAAVRAVLESQFLSLRLHGHGIGLTPAGILATGGASANSDILKVMSDVFGVPVYTGEQTASAALGAAYRAMHGWRCGQEGRFVPFAEVMSSAQAFSKAADPDLSAHKIYTDMLPRFGELEKSVAGQGA